MAKDVEAPLSMGIMDLWRGGKTTMNEQNIHIFLSLSRGEKEKEKENRQRRRVETDRKQDLNTHNRSVIFSIGDLGGCGASLMWPSLRPRVSLTHTNILNKIFLSFSTRDSMEASR